MSLADWTYAPSIHPDQLGAYQYMETRDSGKEQISPGASTCNRNFLVNWTLRSLFLDDLLGYSYLVGSNISRVLPDPHPQYPNFYAMDATVEGLGVLSHNYNSAIDWTLAKVNTNYKPTTYAVLADSDIGTGVGAEMDRYTIREYKFNMDYLTGQGVMKFVTSKRPLASPPGKITASMPLSYTWVEVPAPAGDPFSVPNLSAIQDCAGKVNSEDFDGYPAGTVLFIGVDPKLVTPKLSNTGSANPLGDFHWDINMMFLYRENDVGSDPAHGHNYIYDIQGNIWDLVTDDGTSGGTPIYDEADLRTLWTIG